MFRWIMAKGYLIPHTHWDREWRYPIWENRMYLVELIRRPKEWRYFGQIVLAFVPAVAYFLLQFLYYTGVVVEFTSGMDFGITSRTAWLAIRNTLMMSACPLLTIAVATEMADIPEAQSRLTVMPGTVSG